MSWHKITLPLISDRIDPQVVEIGDLAKDVYGRENKPAGFAMFHATRGSEDELDDKFLIYLSPVCYELCGEIIGELYTLEPCDTPALDEPDIAFVFGDPLMMGRLKEKFEPEPGTVEWHKAEKRRADEELSRALYEADVARIQAEIAQAELARAELAEGESAQAESTQADSAQA